MADKISFEDLPPAAQEIIRTFDPSLSLEVKTHKMHLRFRGGRAYYNGRRVAEPGELPPTPRKSFWAKLCFWR